MEEKKKDLIPVAAIALFLVIIIILCAVRLTQRSKEVEAETSAPAETVERISSTESESEIQTVLQTEAQTEMQTQQEEQSSQDISFQETAESIEETQSSQDSEGKQQTAENTGIPDGWTAPEGSVNSKDPFADAKGVNKTNEEMLSEMAGYWKEERLDAVEDLAGLAWFRRMSASIIDENTFYYYGDRNSLGQPHGTGIAVYADNEYYYGSWVNGKREGQGEWFKKYVYYDNDAVSDRAYQVHMYMGEWSDDLPNGMGQEHVDLDLRQAAKQERYVQNVIGTFKDGLYSGEMYLTTLNWDGNQEEWNGLADSGIWSPYGSGTNKMEVPVCVDVDDDQNFLWLAVKDNKDRGIDELVD